MNSNTSYICNKKQGILSDWTDSEGKVVNFVFAVNVDIAFMYSLLDFEVWKENMQHWILLIMPYKWYKHNVEGSVLDGHIGSFICLYNPQTRKFGKDWFNSDEQPICIKFINLYIFNSIS